MLKNILSRYNIANYSVIPNISEIKRFQKNITPFQLTIPISLTNKKIVLYAGTLGRVNGLKYEVDLAAETLKLDKDIIFLLFGEGRETNEIIEYATLKNVLNINLFLMGTVSKDNLPYLYSIATLGSSFVIDNPVLWDNSANKFFDTLAAARPILINHGGWQSETIKKNNVGYVLPTNLEKKDVVKFVNYINDSILLSQQGKNAYALALKEYSLEVALDKYLYIFKKLGFNVYPFLQTPH